MIGKLIQCTVVLANSILLTTQILGYFWAMSFLRTCFSLLETVWVLRKLESSQYGIAFIVNLHYILRKTCKTLAKFTV